MLIDPVKAKGRKDLVDTCPYGHIWWNEEYQVPLTEPEKRNAISASMRVELERMFETTVFEESGSIRDLFTTRTTAINAELGMTAL